MRPLTIERAVAEAAKAGCTFRLSGSGVACSGLDRVSVFVVNFLREHRAAVYAHLGGDERDWPCLQLLQQLGAELVYCTDNDSAEAAVAEVLADGGDKPIAIDIETAPRAEYANPVPLKLTVHGKPMKVQPKADDRIGLCPYRSEPRLVQLYGGGARVVVLDMRLVSWDMLAPVWDRPIVCHNAAFELAFLAKRGIYPRAQCTMQAAGLLLGVRRRSLANACTAHLGVEVPKTHQTSDWSALILSPGQLAYPAADAVLCRQLWEKTARELKAKGRDTSYRLQRDSLPAAAAMKLRGVGLDLDAHAELCEAWSRDLADARNAWVDITGSPPPAKQAYAAEYLATALSEEALAHWPRTSTGGLSTATAQLEKLRHPAIRPFLRIKKAERLLSAFGPKLRRLINPETGRLHPEAAPAHQSRDRASAPRSCAGSSIPRPGVCTPKLRRLINPETGRLHPHYNVAGTKAGRWSASDPNIQQLPRNAACRRIIVAAPGHVLVGADYWSFAPLPGYPAIPNSPVPTSRAWTCMSSPPPPSTASIPRR